MYEIYGSLAEFRKRSGYSTWTETHNSIILLANFTLFLLRIFNISAASP